MSANTGVGGLNGIIIILRCSLIFIDAKVACSFNILHSYLALLLYLAGFYNLMIYVLTYVREMSG